MQATTYEYKSITPGDIVSISFFILGCIHIALIYVSGFNFWPQEPLIVLGGSFGVAGMVIYFMILLIIWMVVGLIIGAATNSLKYKNN